MSNMTLYPTLVGVFAGAIGVAAYYKASTLQDEVHRPKASFVEKSSHDALEDEVRRLTERVALLERSARHAPRDVPPPTPSPAPPPEPTETGQHPDDVGPAPKDPQQREARKQRAGAEIDAYWREWSAKHGLTSSQTDALCSMQVEASKRKLDNQAKMTDHLLTQPQARADNQVATDEVKRKARALLTAEQFTQFEADKGAEWGSSLRRIREAAAKAAPAP